MIDFTFQRVCRPHRNYAAFPTSRRIDNRDHAAIQLAKDYIPGLTSPTHSCILTSHEPATEDDTSGFEDEVPIGKVPVEILIGV
jgi:hypothetical protein